MIAAAVATEPAGLEAEDVAQLYAAFACRLRRAVSRQVRAGQDDVDDACQVAWGRLFLHRSRVRRETAMGWLTVTARREALRLVRSQRQTVPLEGLGEGADEIEDPDRERPGAIRPPAHAGPSLEILVGARLALQALGELPVRQRRLLWLQGLGLSYEEMARATGDTQRTVERQLQRARQSLRESF